MANDLRAKLAEIVWDHMGDPPYRSDADEAADALLPVVHAYAAQLLHEVADTSCKRGGIPDMILGADVRARAQALADLR